MECEICLECELCITHGDCKFDGCGNEVRENDPNLIPPRSDVPVERLVSDITED